MYNENVKEEFISEYTTNIKILVSCRSFFEAVSPFEERWGKDICKASLEEVQEAVDSVDFGIRRQSGAKLKSMFNQYLRWCIANGIDDVNEDNFNVNFGVNVDILKQRTVVSPMHMQKYLDDVFNSESACTADNIYRCYLWLAYGGFPEKMAPFVKVDDVDLENMVVRLRNKEYPIYREGIHAFRSCKESDRFLIVHPNYTKDVWHDRVDGDFLLRGEKRQPSHTGIKDELSKKIRGAIKDGKTNIRLSYQRAVFSGVFYRIYQLETIGIKPDFYMIAEAVISEKSNSGVVYSVSTMRRKEKELITDYENWKMTFLS